MKRALPLLAFLTGILTAAPAWALFDLSVVTRRGGETLRFSVDSGSSGDQDAGLFMNEEVTLTVDSDLGVPYQILQTLYQPLTNEAGQTLDPNSFFVFSPSAPSGTLRTQLETPVLVGQRQIYASDDAGEPVEFLLAYNVRVPAEQSGGIYRTQLTLTLEPIQGQPGVSPKVITLEVRVEIPPKFRLIARTQGGSRILDLGIVRSERIPEAKIVQLAVETNAAGAYRIEGQWSEPLRTMSGEGLPAGALRCILQGGANGALGPAGSLSDVAGSSPVQLYQSDRWGTQDELALGFEISPDISLQAGSYEGSLVFRVDSSGPMPPPPPVTIPVRLSVEAEFGIKAEVEGGGTLSFGSFKGEASRVERTVHIRVVSNTRSPYQVTQILSRRMSNEKGQIVPEGAFQYQTDRPRTGRSMAPSFAEASQGESALFVSDEKGTPEEIVLTYALDMPANVPPGNYATEISYTITTL